MRKRFIRSQQKGVIYATNQELPRQIFNEASVHSITQDCSSNKTKIIKHVLIRSPYLEKQHQHQRLLSSDQWSSSLSLEPPRHVLRQRPRTQILWFVSISPLLFDQLFPQNLGFEILMVLGYFLDINMFILVQVLLIYMDFASFFCC